VEEPVIPEPENLPPVGSSFTLSINGEEWKDGVLHEVNASDPEGGVVNYSIIDGNQDLDLDGNNTFSLSETGKLSVHDQEDFILQANQTISLNVLLSDLDGKQSIVTGTIELSSAEVLNPVEEPVIPEPENLPPVGSSFTLSVTDEDWKNGVLDEVNASDPEGGVVYYSIIDGNQDFDLDGNNTFSLSENGKLSVHDQEDFLLQADRTISLNILLSDSDGKQSFVTGQIELGSAEVLNPVEEPTVIESENIAPVGSSFTLSVTGEDWKNGVLHEVNANDPEGGAIYYSISYGNQDIDLDGNNTFSLSENGKLTVHDQEDFLLQADQTISLTILLSDSDGKQSFVTGTIELGSAEALNPVQEPVIPEPENLPPVGNSFTLSVTDEDWKNGVLHEVNASDPEGGLVYYSIIAGNQDIDLDGSKTFSLSESGKLIVQDQEDFLLQANQTINLTILLFDFDGKQSFVTGQLELGSEEVLNPVEKPVVSEPENLPPVGNSFTLSVTDEDWKNGVLHEVNASDPEGGVVYYSIIDGNQDFDLDGNKTFSLSESGKLSVLDFEDFVLQSNRTIMLNILLSDLDGKQSFVTGRIELGSEEVLNPLEKPVVSEPENLPPVGSSFTLSITGEDWKDGVLHEVNASDPEGGVVYYSIIDGNQDIDLDGNQTFSLSESGKLSVRDQKDFISQANQSISLNLSLSDSEGKQSFVFGQIELGNGLVLNSLSNIFNKKWFDSDWFGQFFSFESEWLYHSQLGWLYVQLDQTNEGFWFWDPYFQGWWWTSPQVFPYYFISLEDMNQWHYLNLNSQNLQFFDFKSQKWSQRL
jgi:hypothetical protein